MGKAAALLAQESAIAPTVVPVDFAKTSQRQAWTELRLLAEALAQLDGKLW